MSLFSTLPRAAISVITSSKFADGTRIVMFARGGPCSELRLVLARYPLASRAIRTTSSWDFSTSSTRIRRLPVRMSMGVVGA